AVKVPVFTPTIAKFSIAIVSPALWSLEQTNLYRVTTKVINNGKTVDESSLNTGFRTIRFDAQEGFFL
ncbi:hypothetical protein, partial [Streptomyces sp. SID3343]|uniref:hypothetical protein n=1 Tax=Streptomyces sp. SID3343 TaxID=2690260 RepID=UPI001368E3E5